jgi:hypothetical protein
MATLSKTSGRWGARALKSHSRSTGSGGSSPCLTRVVALVNAGREAIAEQFPGCMSRSTRSWI